MMTYLVRKLIYRITNCNDTFWWDDLDEPKMNVKETKTGFELELAVPSFDKKDFEVVVKDTSFYLLKNRTQLKTKKKITHVKSLVIPLS